ncbi:YidB family protein [Bosea sp. (in: a-proteobacteria)]|uniref:YidB family protein n=1 Tax=Bosea sp. (in: a-proteobacteria) TaxID=1871050 RepID=UPI00333EB115
MSNDGKSSGFPSLTALLGLLAVAGYQHRDQIADWFRNNVGGGQEAPPAGGGQAAGSAPEQQAGGGLLGGLGGLLGAGGAGAVLNSGLGELVDRFNQAGQGDKANSWVGAGPNHDVAPTDLEQALGPEVLDAIAKQTGLSREDLLARLSKVLPDAVDRYTPGGSLHGAGA